MTDDRAPMGVPEPAEDLGTTYEALRTGLRNYLRRRVSDPDLVEDLLQEIFLKAVTAIRANRAPRNLTGWLYAAARTTVVDYYRAARPADIQLDENTPEMPHAGDEALHQELALCLRPLVQQLPAIYRDTLLATEFDSTTMQSLADQQGLSLSAIKSRASRARSMLREKLLECCEVEISDGLVTDYRDRSTDSPCRSGSG